MSRRDSEDRERKNESSRGANNQLERRREQVSEATLREYLKKGGW
jgi:hypothetical protein